jgi:hypothetical protein
MGRDRFGPRQLARIVFLFFSWRAASNQQFKPDVSFGKQLPQCLKERDAVMSKAALDDADRLLRLAG